MYAVSLLINLQTLQAGSKAFFRSHVISNFEEKLKWIKRETYASRDCLLQILNWIKKFTSTYFRKRQAIQTEINFA